MDETSVERRSQEYNLRSGRRINYESPLVSMDSRSPAHDANYTADVTLTRPSWLAINQHYLTRGLGQTIIQFVCERWVLLAFMDVFLL